MYNFNFRDNEQLIKIFEAIFVRQNEMEKITTIALTNERLLFLDYITNDGFEVLRITKGINFIRYKDVCYEINLIDIMSIVNDGCYKVVLKDNRMFEFNNKLLYDLLNNMLNEQEKI